MPTESGLRIRTHFLWIRIAGRFVFGVRLSVCVDRIGDHRLGILVLRKAITDIFLSTCEYNGSEESDLHGIAIQ